MYKRALEALENISVTCDEMGMMPTTLLPEKEYRRFDKHFADVFAEEFMIIKDALRELAGYKANEKMDKMWQEQLKFKEENTLKVPNQFELLSLSFYTAIEDKDKDTVFKVLQSVIEEATSLEGCYHYVGSYSPYEEPEFDYDDAEEVERVKLLARIAKHSVDLMHSLPDQAEVELTEDSLKVIKDFMKDTFYTAIEHIDEKVIKDLISDYTEKNDNVY